MKKYYIFILTAIMITGCSLSDVNVEKIDNSENKAVTADTQPETFNGDTELKVNDETQLDSDYDELTVQSDNSEKKLLLNIGESFIPKGMVNSGGYLTVDNAEIFEDLSSVGIAETDLLPNTLLDEYMNPLELCENMSDEFSIAYDKQTGKTINGWKLLKIHYTFENKSAESIVNDLIPLETEKYNDDIFTVGNLNACNIADLNPSNKINYFCWKQIYFSLTDSIEYTGKRQPTFFRCPNEEKVEFDIIYAYKCEPENLYMSPTTGNKLDTMVDLQLGDN